MKNNSFILLKEEKERIKKLYEATTAAASGSYNQPMGFSAPGLGGDVEVIDLENTFIDGDNIEDGSVEINLDIEDITNLLSVGENKDTERMRQLHRTNSVVEEQVSDVEISPECLECGTKSLKGERTTPFGSMGNYDYTDEAEEIFLNPKAHNILATYDHEDAGENGCGAFIPTHIKRSGTWEKTGCPDIKKAEDEVDAERLFAKGDPESYMGLLQEYPKNLREVFARRGANIFNQDKIANQRAELEFNKELPRPERGFLKWVRGQNGAIVGVEWDKTNKGDIQILEHPHWVTQANNPEAPEDEKSPMKNLYVGGCDSIDQGLMDSAHATDNKKGSELSILIKKRVVDGQYFSTTSNIYVAEYHKRSNDVRMDWDNALKLAYYYNSEVNIEYTKIGIVGWFRDQGFYNLLKKRPSIALGNANPTKSTNLVGTQAVGYLIDHMDQKIAFYLENFYDHIFFKDMLNQLQNYNRDDRTKFDMVISMGLCELADEDLMGKVAKLPKRVTEELETFGYYTDDRGFKQYGSIPTNKSIAKDEMNSFIENEKFKQHGSVRWIDATDPSNEKYHY